jgi:hypothetical protein
MDAVLNAQGFINSKGSKNGNLLKKRVLHSHHTSGEAEDLCKKYFMCCMLHSDSMLCILIFTFSNFDKEKDTFLDHILKVDESWIY